MAEIKSPSHPTIDDVARHAGVSTATVSRVINKSGPVAEGTTARVWQSIEHLNYRPRAAARGLASGRTHALGLIAHLVSVPFFAPLLHGIESTAREAGFNLLIHSGQLEPSPGPGFQRPLGPHNTDGLLVFAGALPEAELSSLYESGFPVVLLLQSSPEALDIPYVTFENKSSARKLIEHLIQVHGYRRIAYLQGPEDQEDSHWRERGYREAMGAHGISVDPKLVAMGGVRGGRARAVVADWIRQGLLPEAIFAFDDDSALEAIYALGQVGLRVPEDVAVVGFDDIHLAQYLAPPLTTVRVPVEKAGREAAHQLVRLITEGQAAPVSLLPTELVIRRSCGCELEV